MFPDPTEVLSRGESHSIPYMVRTGETVIVAGVWQEHTVTKYAKIVGNIGRVIFIEAGRDNVARLSKLTKGMPYVTWVNKALWKEKTTLEFTVNDGDYPGWDRIVDDEIPEFPVEKVESCQSFLTKADTLDNICADLGITYVDHVNLTINRAEYAALEGMEKMIDASPNMRIYVATSKRRTPEMTQKLNRLGFAVMTAIPPDKPSRNGKESNTRRVYGIRRQA